MNGRESQPEDAEPMPNVELSEQYQTEEDEAVPERRLLHRYVVHEGGKKWATDVVVERTPLADDDEEHADRSL